MTTTQTSSSPSPEEKLYYRIGDVAQLLGVKAYVLRYWESEFAFIHPQKSATGQRVYKKSDVESLFLIRHLLYIDRYSVEGARKRINELRKTGELKEYKKLALSGTVVAGAAAAEANSAHEEGSHDEGPREQDRPSPSGGVEALSAPVHAQRAVTGVSPSLSSGLSGTTKIELLKLAQELSLLAQAPLSNLFKI